MLFLYRLLGKKRVETFFLAFFEYSETVLHFINLPFSSVIKTNIVKFTIHFSKCSDKSEMLSPGLASSLVQNDLV